MSDGMMLINGQPVKEPDPMKRGPEAQVYAPPPVVNTVRDRVATRVGEVVERAVDVIVDKLVQELDDRLVELLQCPKS